MPAVDVRPGSFKPLQHSIPLNLVDFGEELLGKRPLPHQECFGANKTHVGVKQENPSIVHDPGVACLPGPQILKVRLEKPGNIHVKEHQPRQIPGDGSDERHGDIRAPDHGQGGPDTLFRKETRGDIRQGFFVQPFLHGRSTIGQIDPFLPRPDIDQLDLPDPIQDNLAEQLELCVRKRGRSPRALSEIPGKRDQGLSQFVQFAFYEMFRPPCH